MLIDDVSSLRIFVQVIAAGSLSAAGRALGLSVAVVSKRLAQLESTLGVRLLQRSTRKQVLTEEGELLHARALRILSEIEQTEMLMASRRDTVGGTLRITACCDFGRRWLVPVLAEFRQLHPQLQVQLELTDVVRDLLESDTDIALRFGSLPDSSLIAREIAPNHRVLCASPAYLQRHGAPARPQDLVAHDCIAIGQQPRVTWQFDKPEATMIRIHAAIVTNDGDAARVLALQGAGIALKSIWDVGDDIAAGRLQQVLSDCVVPSAPLHAIVAHRKSAAPRVGAFIAFLQGRLQDQWRWPRQPLRPR